MKITVCWYTYVTV